MSEEGETQQRGLCPNDARLGCMYRIIFEAVLPQLLVINGSSLSIEAAEQPLSKNDIIIPVSTLTSLQFEPGRIIGYNLMLSHIVFIQLGKEGVQFILQTAADLIPVFPQFTGIALTH